MVRMDVDIDQEACEELMRLCGFSTQAEAINFALRTQAGQRRRMEEARARILANPKEMEAIRGIGWEEGFYEMHDGGGPGPTTS